MFVADMHCDSLLAVGGERGLVTDYNFSKKNPHLQFVAEFCPRKNRDAAERRRILLNYLNTYLYECERLSLSRITTGKDVFDFMGSSGNAALLSIEGGGGLFSASHELDVLYGAGLRVMSFAWDDNELAASAWTSNDYGLTDEGRELLSRCSELGIIIDVSHLSDKAFYQTLEEYHTPVLATHSNFRDICPSKRNLTLDMAEKIVARGGVIGLNLYPEFLNEGGADTSDILRHTEYALEHLGEDALGFGFDIDGIDTYPDGIRLDFSIHDQVVDLLLSHYSASVVEKLAGLNVLEFLKNNLP